MQARWKRARSPPARRRVYRTTTRQRSPNLPEFSPEGKANPPTTNMIGSDHAWNGVHIPFPSLGHLTELLSEPTVERVSKRSEEHTSELQSLMRISYAVFCLKKKINIKNNHNKYMMCSKTKRQRATD